MPVLLCLKHDMKHFVTDNIFNTVYIRIALFQRCFFYRVTLFGLDLIFMSGQFKTFSNDHIIFSVVNKFTTLFRNVLRINFSRVHTANFQPFKFTSKLYITLHSNDFE